MPSINTMAVMFMAGWFDRQDKRLDGMRRDDRALNSERKTKTVRTVSKNCWGMS